MREKGLFSWGEMLAGYLVLAFICLTMLAGNFLGWVFDLPARLFRWFFS